MSGNSAVDARGPEVERAGAPAMAVDIPPSHHRIRYFRKLVDTLSTGAEPFPCSLLLDGNNFAGRQALHAVHARDVEMAWVNASHLEALAPELAVLTAPFVTHDLALGRTGRASAMVDLLDTALKGSGVRAVGLMRGADQLFVYPDGQFDDVSDLSGLRVRVAGPGMYVELMSALGAQCVEMPIPRIAAAFTSGDVDCVFTSPGGWRTQVFDSARHATWVPGLMFINYVLIANERWIASLSPEARARLRRTVDAEVTSAWSSMRLDDERLLDQMRSEGAQISLVQDLQPWKTKTASVSASVECRFPATVAALSRIQGH